MPLILAQAAAAISSSTGLELGLATVVGGALLGLGGWSAILRHRQDDNSRTIRRLVRRVETLEHDKTARDAISADKAGRAPGPARSRPADSTTGG